MVMLIYSIFDKCSGIYSEPFCCVNEEVAKRRFLQICSSSPSIAPDLQLFKLGNFDSTQGLIVEPVRDFVCGGKING